MPKIEGNKEDRKDNDAGSLEIDPKHCGAVRGEVSSEMLGVNVRNVMHIMLSNQESEGKAQK